MRQWVGSIVYTILLFASVPIYSMVCICARIFGYGASYAVAHNWCVLQFAMLRGLCRIDYSVEGLERLPVTSSVVLMKHSSAWETMAQVLLFPRQCWVLKRELMWVPLLGWAIACMKPIAIDRKGGRASVEQVMTLGRQRLDEGLWISIFPEGTRVREGETRRYGLSGALLAQAAGRAIVPVAHDAGRYWPRRGLYKKRGTIRVVIGEPIATAGRDPRELTAEVQSWIEARLAEMAASRQREIRG
jgi:1-acyl-sn-glycerol-3-phosphate acyltransferase